MKNHLKHVLLALALTGGQLFLPHAVRADLPFLGEIRWVAFNFAPQGWATCSGQLLPINQNQALFSLLGTTFGGDGRVNFALPDLRGRAPISEGNGHTLGERGGEINHTLTASEMPFHTHTLAVDAKEGNVASPVGAYPAKSATGAPAYGGQLTTVMAPGAVANVGGSQAHSNMKPYQAMTCIIAMTGAFPTP